MKQITEIKQAIKLWDKLVKENKNSSSFNYYRSIYLGEHLVIRVYFDYFEYKSADRTNTLRMHIAYKYEYAKFHREWDYKLDVQEINLKTIEKELKLAVKEFDELKRRWND